MEQIDTIAKSNGMNDPSLDQIDFRLLRLFEAIHSAGSITGAA